MSIATLQCLRRDLDEAKYFADREDGMGWQKKCWDVYREMMPVLLVSSKEEDKNSAKDIDDKKDAVSKYAKEKFTGNVQAIRSGLKDDGFLNLLRDWEMSMRLAMQRKGMLLSEKQNTTGLIS